MYFSLFEKHWKFIFKSIQLIKNKTFFFTNCLTKVSSHFFTNSMTLFRDTIRIDFEQNGFNIIKF